MSDPAAFPGAPGDGYPGDFAGRSVEEAAAALTHPDPGTRERAAFALEEMGTEAAAAALVPLIASADIGARNLAGETLVRMGAVSVPALLPAVDDPDHDVRKFAVDLLALLPEAARPHAAAIAARLEDPDPNVQLAAIDCLAELGAAPFARPLSALFDREPLMRASIVMALGKSGAAATALLARALGDEDPVVQFAAAEALGAGDDPQALEWLLECARMADDAARPVALYSLVQWCRAQGAAAPALPADLEGLLLWMLSDAEADYRRAAADGLALVERYYAEPERAAYMLPHAGYDDALDVALFRALATHQDPVGDLAWAVGGEAVQPGAAAQFALALVAQGVVAEEAYGAAADVLYAVFPALDADAKLTVVGLSARLGHAAFAPVLALARQDADPVVAVFAEDSLPRPSGASPAA